MHRAPVLTEAGNRKGSQTTSANGGTFGSRRSQPPPSRQKQTDARCLRLGRVPERVGASETGLGRRPVREVETRGIARRELQRRDQRVELTLCVAPRNAER
jgi:hypothetical protein